jgi:7tm Chemosensory receptor
MMFTTNFYTLYCFAIMMIVATTNALFSFLNRSIENIYENHQQSELLRALKKVDIIYYKLCDTCELVSSTFLSLCLYSLYQFMYFYVFSIFCFIISFKNPGPEAVFFTICGVCWVCLYSPFVFWMIIFSNRIKNQTSNMAEKAQTLLMKDKSLEVSRSINNLLLSMSHRAPHIDCRLFGLNWKLLFVILASILSYELILIQFEAAE